MLRSYLQAASGVLSTLLLLPAVDAVAQPAAAAPPIEPITLAEATASGATAQAVEPMPPEPAPAIPGELAPAAPPAPSPWAGTLELYGFAPLRATTSLTRGARQRDLSGLLANRRGERQPGQRAGVAAEPLEQLPDLTVPSGGRGLRERLAGRLPD
ncbi:MAG: hypothetical protein ACK549_05055, partial [Cyanobacteriota bacterium]